MKQVNLSLETAKEMYKSNDPSIKKFALDNYTKEELEAIDLPKRWEDIGIVTGFYIGLSSEITKHSSRSTLDNRNLLPTKELAEAMLALCQLLYLRNIYNGDWKADYSKSDTKYTIFIYNKRIDYGTSGEVSRVLAFKSLEIRKQFYENFKTLIEIARPLL